MKLVDTEWFAFIDSDVVLLPGWYEKAMQFMKLKNRIMAIQDVFLRESTSVINK